jgi:hypothetical protein
MDMPNAKQLGAKLKTTEETKSIPAITLERGFSLQDFWFGNLKSPTLSLFDVLLLMVLLALAFVVLIMFART